MTITVTPEDLIRRCLWTDYIRYVHPKADEESLSEIVNKNEPMVISEREAFAIGLLKIIETDNLVHRFKKHMYDILQTKSNLISTEEEEDEMLYINRNLVIKEAQSFGNRFPSYYEPCKDYSDAIQNLNVFISKVVDEFENMETISVPVRDKVFNYLKSRAVKKVVDSV